MIRERLTVNAGFSSSSPRGPKDATRPLISRALTETAAITGDGTEVSDRVVEDAKEIGRGSLNLACDEVKRS